MKPQTKGYTELLRDEDASLYSQAHAVIPALFAVSDARESGLIEPGRRMAAARVTFAAHAGGVDRQEAFFHVHDQRSLVVHRAVVAIVDAATGFDPRNIETGASWVTPDWAHLVLRNHPNAAGAAGAAIADQDLIPVGGAIAAPWDLGAIDGGIVHRWTAAAWQVVPFATPIHVTGTRGATDDERSGFKVTYERTFGVGDQDAVLIWLDCASGPRGTIPR